MLFKRRFAVNSFGFVIVAAVACGIVGVLGLGYAILSGNRPPPSAEQGPPPSELRDVPLPFDSGDFIGSEVCGNCHSRIWQSYRKHPMAQSLAAPLEATPIERYDVTEFSPPGPRRYQVERLAEGMRHHEALTDDDGTLLYDQAVDVSYALGSGKRGRAYLIEHDGRFFKSSLAWYSRRNEWGLAPDYNPDRHKRFERRITDGCINCHAGRMEAVPGAPDRFAKPVVVEAAIGCERCHGPGRRHVEAHESATDKPLNHEYIVNPSRLDPARRESICAQCHLHGEATVVRTGQKVFDFRPGQRLEDNRIVFVRAMDANDVSGTGALSQVEQMLTSACFRKSDGRLGCTSCHDPHSVPAPESRVEFYQKKCLACHENQGCTLPAKERLDRDPTDSCMACHMPPSLEVRDILHVSFADHRILRNPKGQPAPDAANSRPTAGVMVFDQADQRLPKLEFDRARAFMLVRGTEHKNPTSADAWRAEQLLLPVHRAQPGDVDTLELLAAACLMQRRNAEAEEWCLEVMKIDPHRESTLKQLAVLYQELRRIQPALEYLQRFLEVNSEEGAMHGRYAAVLGAAGNWRECISAGEQALRVNPTLVPLHDLLAQAYAQVGEPLESERHRILYQRMKRLLPQAEQSPPTDRRSD